MTKAERIIEVCNLNENGNMSSFARKTGVTPAYISKLKNKPDSEPSAIFIKEICRQYNVNETWLLSGEGEMYGPESKEQKIAQIVSRLATVDEPVKLSLISLLSRADESQLRTVIMQMYEELKNNGFSFDE